MIFMRSDTVYKDYNWNAIYNRYDVRIAGELDHTTLNRMIGYEVLYFINKCKTAWGWRSKKAMRRLEIAIRTEVPAHIKNQLDVKKWIEENIYQQHSFPDPD